MKEIIGQYIENIHLDDSNGTLSLLVNVAKSSPVAELAPIWPTKSEYAVLQFSAQGDCCNNVWFEDFVAFDVLLKTSIFSVEEKGWTQLDASNSGDEYLDSGFWTIKTSRGYADLELRNSHNGYYGGYVSFDGIYTDIAKFSDKPTTPAQLRLAVSMERHLFDTALDDIPKRGVRKV